VITEVSTPETNQETNQEEFDLASVMQSIRARAEERRSNSLIDTAAILARLLGENGASEIALRDANLPAGLSLQPEFEIQERYRVEDFLRFQDTTFVRNAYRGILQREPDDAGFTQYLNALRAGRLNKIDILARLRFSAEGRDQNVTVDGLSRKAQLRKLYRVPVLGYVLELGVSLFRLPALVAEHRRLEAHIAGQDERLAAHTSETAARLARHIEDTARDFVARVDELREAQRQLAVLNQQQIKGLFREQHELTEDQNRLKQATAAFRDATEQQFKAQTLTDEILLQKLQEFQEFVEAQVVQKLQRTRAELVLQERRVTTLAESRREVSTAAASNHQAANETDPLMNLLYSSLEDQFRGSRADIKEAFQIYLPILKAAKVRDGILDVGCGRGEWLEVLRDEGLLAGGIDANQLSVRECRQAQLDVSEADVLTHLRSLPDSSLNCITAFHLVEHLPLQMLAAFLDESLRVLKTGGFFILETPNPENVIVATCNFYFDPTHRNPLPPPTMKCILESRGFGRLETLELHPMLSERLIETDELSKRFNRHFYGPMDYAIVAQKV
jgi:O-antigen chain-terminating methyltransferase